MSEGAAGAAAHALLMDATYRYQRHFYDATRRFFLLGRDRLIEGLAPPPGGTVLEIACGTGRNLARIDRVYPGRRLYGMDISAQMLKSARAKLPGTVHLAPGDACTFSAPETFGVAGFDRIVMSYCVSMIPDWRQAVTNAVGHLSGGGELHIVDFGDQARLPGWFRSGLHAWLAQFHVTPRSDLSERLEEVAAGIGATVRCRSIFGDYARDAVLAKPRAGTRRRTAAIPGQPSVECHRSPFAIGYTGGAPGLAG